MKYDITDTCNTSTEAQDNKKLGALPYITPTLILLEFDAQDIASGGNNPGPDGTFGNNS